MTTTLEVKQEFVKLETSLCLRSYNFNDIQVNKIHFYNESGVVYTTRFGWLEKVSYIDKEGYIFNYDILKSNEYLLIKQPVKKLKVNLNLKQNFYIKSKEQTWHDSEYELYLYIDNKDIKLDFIKSYTYENGNDSNCCKITRYYYSLYNLYINNMPEVVTINSIDKIEYIKTSFGCRLDDLQNEFKKDNINISNYELEKILKAYNIIKK